MRLISLALGVFLAAATAHAAPLPTSTIGHYIACRGYRAHSTEFLNGALVRCSGNADVNTTGIGAMVIGNGTAMTARKAHWGRRLMPEEAARLTEILAAA